MLYSFARRAARDRRWEYATLISHNVEVPAEALRRRGSGTLLQPHSRLVPARWVSAAQASIRSPASSSEALWQLGKEKGYNTKGGEPTDE